VKLPLAILFDLDDTILVAFGPAQSQWQRTIAAFADRLGPIEAAVIAAAIQAASTELWADPARHKYWRHEAMLASLDRLEALEKSGARIYFGHDPEFWRSVPQAPAAIA
jgi:hypothetical protein